MIPITLQLVFKQRRSPRPCGRALTRLSPAPEASEQGLQRVPSDAAASPTPRRPKCCLRAHAQSLQLFPDGSSISSQSRTLHNFVFSQVREAQPHRRRRKPPNATQQRTRTPGSPRALVSMRFAAVDVVACRVIGPKSSTGIDRATSDASSEATSVNRFDFTCRSAAFAAAADLNTARAPVPQSAGNHLSSTVVSIPVLLHCRAASSSSCSTSMEDSLPRSMTTSRTLRGSRSPRPSTPLAPPEPRRSFPSS